MKTKGTLFLCATPIGNLGDITFRLVETLKSVHLVAAEDTKHSRKLLNYLGLQKKMLSYHEHNKEQRGQELIDYLVAGQDVALVSDAGWPGISDPGEQLVAKAVAAGIKIVPIPGANAALCALTASGLSTTPFFFGGFLPKTKKHRQEKLRLWQQVPATIILYEAPHRLEKVLQEIKDSWGDRKLVLARELTKLYEEFFHGSISESLAWLKEQPARGEFTLVIEQTCELAEKTTFELSPLARIQELLAAGQTKKEALKVVAKEYALPKRELYQALLVLEEK